MLVTETLVTVCLPTRGRPYSLQQALEGLLEHKTLPSTRIAVAIDEDDEKTLKWGEREECKYPSDVIFFKIPRPDTLGEKYNILAESCPARLYLQHADDQIITTPGWDEKLIDSLNCFNESELPDAGLVYFGQGAGNMPANMAMSETWRQLHGGIFPPYFPQWWHETWNDEIANMTGRILWNFDIQVQAIGGRGKTQSIMNPEWWAKWFQLTRPIRVKAAQELLERVNERPWRVRQLIQQAPLLYQVFDQRESGFHDPETVKAVMTQMAAPVEKGDEERQLRAQTTAIRVATGAWGLDCSALIMPGEVSSSPASSEPSTLAQSPTASPTSSPAVE